MRDNVTPNLSIHLVERIMRLLCFSSGFPLTYLLSSPYHPPSLGIEAMLVAAMKGWALLATISTRAICLDMLPTLCGLLDSPCPDVRNTAGESLAMLYELHFAPYRESNDDAEEGEGGTVQDEAESNTLSTNIWWDEVRYQARDFVVCITVNCCSLLHYLILLMQHRMTQTLAFQVASKVSKLLSVSTKRINKNVKRWVDTTN